MVAGGLEGGTPRARPAHAAGARVSASRQPQNPWNGAGPAPAAASGGSGRAHAGGSGPAGRRSGKGVGAQPGPQGSSARSGTGSSTGRCRGDEETAGGQRNCRVPGLPQGWGPSRTSLAASPRLGQGSGRQLGSAGNSAPTQLGVAAWCEGVSFNHLCHKFAHKTKGNDQVGVQTTLQPLHPESLQHLPSRLCLPAACHDPGEPEEATRGHKPGPCRKPGSKPLGQRPAQTRVDGGAHHGESQGCDGDRAVSPEPHRSPAH